MKARARLAELRNLQNRADTLRRKLSLSRTGEVIFLASCGGTADDTVIVEADGFGGATTKVVIGNYPVDYVIKFERFFRNEERAAMAAEKIAFSGNSPNEVLGEPT